MPSAAAVGGGGGGGGGTGRGEQGGAGGWSGGWGSGSASPSAEEKGQATWGQNQVHRRIEGTEQKRKEVSLAKDVT